MVNYNREKGDPRRQEAEAKMKQRSAESYGRGWCIISANSNRWQPDEQKRRLALHDSMTAERNRGAVEIAGYRENETPFCKGKTQRRLTLKSYAVPQAC